MSIEKIGFGDFVTRRVRRWFFSEQDIRRAVRAGILGLYARLDTAAVIAPHEKQALRRTVRNLKEEIISLNRRYRSLDGRTSAQIDFNRARIRRMIDDVRFLEEVIDAAPER